MKWLLLTILFLVPVNKGFTQEKPGVISSEISNVTVFLHGAQVIREADVNLPAGKSTLILQGISPLTDQQSIQLRGEGEFTVLALNYRMDFLHEGEETPMVKDLTIKIKELEKKIEDDKVIIEVLREKESFLTSNKVLSGTDKVIDPNDFLRMFEVYGKNMEGVKTGLLLKQREIRESIELLERLKKQLGETRRVYEKQMGEVEVTLSATRPVKGKLMMSYFVIGARWFPSYDIRVDEVGEPVKLVYKANVIQQTEEEWRDVLLTFSNASPDQSGTVPVPYPYFIDFYEPAVYRAQGVAEDGRKRSAILHIVEDNEELEMAAPFELSVDEKQTSKEFSLNIPYTIPTGSRPVTIDMQTLLLPADFRYRSIPRLNPAAFLIAKVYDWEQFDLLNGEANLYFENTFVGKSMINTRVVSDTLDVSLGRDPGVIVKREKRVEFTSRRFIGNNRIENRSWEITVRNNKGESVSLELTDQVPVSQNRDITVDIEELSGGKLDREMGFVTWALELEPGESKSVTLTYSVRYPRDRSVWLE